MQINFKVTDRIVNPLDPRCSAFPGEDCALVRLSPVNDDHVAAVGDVVVCVLKADADKLVVEQPEVKVANPVNPKEMTGEAPPSLVAKAAVAGTKAVLTIG